ncbi:uncharacterized protein [Paramisgurnus dabryanus]|uniref:uncharacterized protein n=1 Tax=Paramisgurnus dabryanus TaxID=90735 RepID=UPI003CCF568F
MVRPWTSVFDFFHFTECGLVSAEFQPSPPNGSTAPAAPPQPQPSASSQQNNADKVETSLSSPLSPPHIQVPPPASRPQRRALKRPAPSSQDDQDEMEPPPKRARLNGLSAEVTRPQAQTASSSQQNKADAGEVDCSSVSQHSSNNSRPIRPLPPPASPPQRRALKRPAPSSKNVQDEMEPPAKRARLCLTQKDLKAQQSSPDGLSAQVMPPQAQLSPPHSQVPPPVSPPQRRALKRPAPSSKNVQDEMEPPAKRARLCLTETDFKAQHSSPVVMLAEVTPPQAQLSPPHGQVPPPASRLQRRRLWRSAPSSQDKMEPTPRRVRLKRLSAQVTPPLSQKQNKPDTAVADCSSVSQHSTINSRPIRQVSPPASHPQRRSRKRLAPCSSQEASEGMVSKAKIPRLDGMF